MSVVQGLLLSFSGLPVFQETACRFSARPFFMEWYQRTFPPLLVSLLDKNPWKDV